MKINHLLLSLASISVAVLSARSATLDKNTECVTLPAYTVVVPRQTSAERAVSRSLDELRAAARTPMAVKVEIPLASAHREARNDAPKLAPVLVVARD